VIERLRQLKSVAITPNTNTCRSGREREIPLANGSADVNVMGTMRLDEYGKRSSSDPSDGVMFSCNLRFSISLK